MHRMRSYGHRRRSASRRATPARVEGPESRRLLSIALVKDVNPQDRYPFEITQSGAYTYYVSRDAAGGDHLERVDSRGHGSGVLFNDPNPASFGRDGASTRFRR